MRLYLSIVLLAFTSTTFSQWMNSSMADYLAVVNKSPLATVKKKAFSFESDYLFYNTYEDLQPQLTYHSTFFQDNNLNIYFDQFGKQTIQDVNYKVILDTIEKTVVVTAADSVFQEAALFDIANYKNGSVQIKKNEDANNIKFSLELPDGLKYKGIEVWFDHSSNLTKMIFYASGEVESAEIEGLMTRPRLEIIFKNYSYSLQKALKSKTGDIIRFENETIVLREKYKGFELIDLRKKI